MSTTTQAAKYTPGPWKQGKFGSVIGGEEIQYANGKAQSQIASVTIGYGITEEERDANARLIAAAPRMAEALKDALNALRWIAADSAPGWSNLGDAARVVIPQAEQVLRDAGEEI